jgi:putative oligomerization/nucleic acid binding protein
VSRINRDGVNHQPGHCQTTAEPESSRISREHTLRKLVSLHDEGLLTDEEFAAKRAEVIARI